MSEIINTKHPAVYPYLVTRLGAAFYDITILPNIASDQLLVLAKKHQLANNTRCCIVLSPNYCIYVEADAEIMSNEIPEGGLVLDGVLEKVINQDDYLDRDNTIPIRQLILNTYIRSQKGAEYLFD